MFMGTYRHKLDSRDRLSVPAKIRDTFLQLSNRHPILTAGFDRCLFLIPYERWQNLAENSQALQTTKENARTLERFLFACAEECPFDLQGRILIPSALKKLAGLKDQVTILGIRNRVEIWNSETWDEEHLKMSTRIGEMAEQSDTFSI